MSRRLGVRDVTRNFSILYEYDYVEIEDKKTKQIKGMFVSERYIDDVKAFIEAKKEEEMRQKMEEIRRLAGKGRIAERFDGLTAREIRKKVAKEKESE